MNMLSISCEPYVSVYPMKGSHSQSHPSYAPVLVVRCRRVVISLTLMSAIPAMSVSSLWAETSQRTGCSKSSRGYGESALQFSTHSLS